MDIDPGKKLVEVFYLEGCPNCDETVSLARGVVSELGIEAEVRRVEVRSVEEARRLRFLGSPSVHIDGVDVERDARSSTAFALACRTYGPSKVPPRQMLIEALGESRKPTAPRRGSWRTAAGALPGVSALLLPVGTCPACWPAYAGFLSSFGLGALLYERYLLPIAVLLLAGALGSLGYRAPSRRGYGPLLLGMVGSLIALGGKFSLASTPVLAVGVGVLIAAAGWNAWPRKVSVESSCERCAPQEGASLSRAHAGERQ